ncbi:Na+/H+ antiporter [Flavihumibacter stibioxidans]|uniref:Na+/H+ antiporter n=1 Tax=Flavihumibacter stibioxidans TaxID=1834163 RepID=A0ABR7MAG6_9BACT|nr:Na+/H+ antiporter [Flavihumibacter stibioxidans]MBC6491499.1 Na+/H+ antiporter [Flavihumibacter stibioxidans]
MIHEQLLLVIALFFLMAMLYLLSQRFNISYPIFLVMGGLAISFIPAIPNIIINPDLVFLIFLPPLLFEAAWHTSWNNFWKWKRPILLMGFGLVFCTSLAIAYLSASIIPGFTLALGFLLGGIISPPDAVAATSVLKGMDMPRRGMAILEGESLVNDAASLTVFRFALAAVLTGEFVFQKAATDFLVLAVMGVFIGLVIGHILYLVLRFWAKSSSITTPITLIAPYLMYIIAEEFHWSGVLSVVSGGLLLSYRSKDYLNYHTRMQTKEVWETVGFLLNGFVFILIGLELPVIVGGLGDYSISEAIWYSLIICAVIIVIRIALVYLMDAISGWFGADTSVRDKNARKLDFIIGWAGMRGVVSLASALAVPLVMNNGEAFPHRNLILFITFVVILVTLVIQGLTLPLILRTMKMKEEEDVIPPEDQIDAIRLQLTREALAYLRNKYPDEQDPRDAIGHIRELMERKINLIEQDIQEQADSETMASQKVRHKEVMLELVGLRRNGLQKLREAKAYDDEVLRDMEYNLDLEEARLSRY